MKSNNFTGTSTAELLQLYATAACGHAAASDKGNYRTANANYLTVAAIYRELKARGPEGRLPLLGLLDHSDEAVRGMAAAHALEFAPEKGEPVLKALISSPGIWGLDARVILEEWRKGTLTFP